MDYTVSHHLAFVPAAEYIRNYRDEQKFIAFCRECNRYGRCWACPPYDFDTSALINDYRYIYIIGTKIIPSINLRQQCTTVESRKAATTRLLVEVRTRIDPCLTQLEKEHPGSLAFFAGTCHLCPDVPCTRITNLPCRHPSLVRHSLESFGFDLGRTANELLHIPLQWSDGEKLPDYLMLISGLFTNDDSGILEQRDGGCVLNFRTQSPSLCFTDPS